MPVVKYNDDNGFLWAVVVPPNVEKDQWEYGVVIGPPDLSGLGLTKNETKRLHNALVEADLYSVKTVKGNTGELLALLKKLFPKKNGKELVRQIKSVLQQEYFKEIST